MAFRVKLVSELLAEALGLPLVSESLIKIIENFRIADEAKLSVKPT